MRSDSAAFAVSMMIGTAAVAGSLRSARHTVRPSTPGSIRSSTTRSAGVSRSRGTHVAAGVGDVDHEAVFLEVVADEARDVRVVFGHEDARHVRLSIAPGRDGLVHDARDRPGSRPRGRVT